MKSIKTMQVRLTIIKKLEEKFNPDETKNIAEISVDTYDLINEIEPLEWIG